MRERLRRIWLPLALAGLALRPAASVAQTPNPFLPAAQNRSVADAAYVAIMGHVGQPGVYECRLPIDLAEVIHRSGGLAADASGNIRLIRNGRSGQQAFFSPGVKFELLPGDILMADRKRGGTLPVDATRRTNPVPRGSYSFNATANAPPTMVQIALVQLLDRPVVLELPTELATVRGLLAGLKQPETGTGSVTVLKPAVPPQVVSFDDAAKVALTSGTVVVFDARYVIPSTLPPLPLPIRLEPEAPATIPSSPAATAVPVQTETPKLEIAVPTVAASLPSVAPTPAMLAASEPPPPPPIVTPEPIIYPKPVMRSEPIASTATGGLFSTLSEPEPRLVLPPEPEDVSTAVGTTRTKSESSRRSVALATARNPSDTSDKNGTPLSSTAALLLTGGFIGLCVAMTFWRVGKRTASVEEPESNETQPQPVAASRSVLDALIENELPVTDERLSFSPGVHLYGRPFEPLRLRTDDEHALQGPHFLRPKVPVERVPALAVPAAKTVASNASGKKHRTDAAHPASDAAPANARTVPAVPKLLDRVLAAVQRGGKQ